MLTLGALRGDEPSFGDGLVRVGEKAFKTHLLKPSHHLLEAFFSQLGCAFHPCHPFQNLSVRFFIQVKVFLGDMNDRLFLPTDGHFFIIA